MEWALLLLFALLAAGLVGLPRWSPASTLDAALDIDEARERQRLLLAELRDLDEDAAAGRISAADRREGRRALAPRLRATGEALRRLGEGPRERTDAAAAHGAEEQAGASK